MKRAIRSGYLPLGRDWRERMLAPAPQPLEVANDGGPDDGVSGAGDAAEPE